MNPLRTLENMIAGLVEGTFGRVFKSEVRPMELAHKLAREMDENKTVSVSRVYAPNEYSVWLSPRDRARYDGVEQQVIDELCAYLLEHARGEDLALASRPTIAFHTDEGLQLGEFGIEARMVRQEDNDEPAPLPGATSRGRPAERFSRRESMADLPGEPSASDGGESGSTMIFSNSARVREAVERTGARRRSKALLTVAGRQLLVAPSGAVIGRSRDCDVVLEDSAVSRRHAEVRPAEQAWAVEDLESTNGVRVNGVAVRGTQKLHSGDRIEVGSTEMLFEIAP
jgi:Protein of unknown function (DUF3662)/FHA domain